MARIAVIGPGAIGATVAAVLAETANHSITVCARSPVSHLMIETDAGPITASPHVITAVDQGIPCDWVLVTTKAYNASSAALWFPKLMDIQTRLAVLQNGVEHIARFTPYVSANCIVPVVVDMPVERIAAGHFRLRRRGRLTVAADARGDAFAHLFAKCNIDVSTVPDLHSTAWTKLALNCAGPVSALVLKPSGIARNPAIAGIMKALASECVAVGRAEGATLDEHLADTVVDAYRNGPADAINSLHADRLAGRRIEIDARNGAVIRLGRKHNIDTPVNEMIVSLLEAAAA